MFPKYATPQFYRKYATTIDWLYWLTSQVGERCIFTVKMLTFSGKHAGNVMGENELDCSAILLGQEGSIFWVVVKDMLEL